MKPKQWYALAAASCLIPGLLALPAQASPLSPTDEALSDIGTNVTSANVTLNEAPDGTFTAQIDDVLVEVEDDAVILNDESRDAPTVTVEIQHAEPAEPADLSSLGGVTLVGDGDASTTILPKEDGSLQMATVIESVDAPSTYAYRVEGSLGSHLVLEEDGSINLVSPSGEWEAGILPPWATDALGNAVPTHYTVDGNEITQHVDFDETSNFPIVADPWMGLALVNKINWHNSLWKWSPTLRVYPTKWARTTGPAARGAMWKETVAKAPRHKTAKADTASMKNQLYCHFDFVRIRSPRKEYWGLDSKLPNRGYTGFVKKGCN